MVIVRHIAGWHTFIIPVLVAAFITTAAAQSPSNSPSTYPHTPPVGSAMRREILDAIRVPFERELHQAIIFKVDLLNVVGDWAATSVTPIQKNGGPIRGWTGRGVAILARSNGAWHALKWSANGTDAALADWARSLSAPSALLATSQNMASEAQRNEPVESNQSPPPSTSPDQNAADLQRKEAELNRRATELDQRAAELERRAAGTAQNSPMPTTSSSSTPMEPRTSTGTGITPDNGSRVSSLGALKANYNVGGYAYRADKLERGVYYEIGPMYQVRQVTGDFILLNEYQASRKDQLFGVLIPHNKKAFEDIQIRQDDYICGLGSFAGFKDVTMTTGASERLPVFDCVGIQVGQNTFYDLR
jgi:hypothetical protein